MPILSKMKKISSYFSTLQICMGCTFVFVVFLTAKFSSVAIFDLKPEKLLRPQLNQHLHPLVPSRPNSKNRHNFDYIIDNQRVRIQTEMEHYPFDNNQQLLDLIPDQGGQPIRAMVI